jgi:hypothetical protein
MADTMATPYSDWLLLILRRNGLKRQNYSEMNDMPAPIAISSNGAKSRVPRRHLAFIRRWGFGTRQPQKDQCRTDAEKNPTLCRRGCNPPARFPKRAQPDRAPKRFQCFSRAFDSSSRRCSIIAGSTPVCVRPGRGPRRHHHPLSTLSIQRRLHRSRSHPLRAEWSMTRCLAARDQPELRGPNRESDTRAVQSRSPHSPANS